MKPFEKIVKKGENACDQHFFPFSTIFLTISKLNFNFLVTLFCHSQMLSISTGLKFCLLVIINLYHTIVSLTIQTFWENGENAGDQNFLFFPQCLLHFQANLALLEPHIIFAC